MVIWLMEGIQVKTSHFLDTSNPVFFSYGPKHKVEGRGEWKWRDGDTLSMVQDLNTPSGNTVSSWKYWDGCLW